LRSCCVLQDHYDNERDKIVFQYTTSDLQDQDQDHSVQDQDQDRFFWPQTGLVLRPTVWYDITAISIHADDVALRRRYCDHLVTMCVCVGVYVSTIERKPPIGMTW